MISRLLKRMARRHWEATRDHMHAEVRWESRPQKAHENEYAFMQAAVDSLYEAEGEMIDEDTPSYKGLNANQLATMIVDRLKRTEEVYGVENVTDAAPLVVDVGLARAMRDAIHISPIHTDNPILKACDQLHAYLTQRIQHLQTEDDNPHAIAELTTLANLVSSYETQRWGVPKMFRNGGKRSAPSLTN